MRKREKKQEKRGLFDWLKVLAPYWPTVVAVSLWCWDRLETGPWMS